MRMSAVSNPLNYFSDTAVAVPLVLGASNRTFNAFPFSWGAKQIVPELMTPAIKRAARKEAKELIATELAEEMIEASFKKGLGRAGRKKLMIETAQEVAEKEGIDTLVAQGIVKKEMTKISIDRAAVSARNWLLRYGTYAGVGFAVWHFGAGAVGTIGDAMGAAGAAAAQGAIEWMGDNPGMAIGGTLLVLLFIGGVILTAVAPSIAAKKAKDKVTQGDDA